MDNTNPDPAGAYQRSADPHPPDADVRSATPVDGAPLPTAPPAPGPPLFPYETAPQPLPQPEHPRHRSLPWIFGSLLGAAALAAALWGFGAFEDPEPAAVTGDVLEVVEVREVITPADDQTSAAAVARKVVPSIVTVDVGTNVGGGFERFGSGSGVVLRSDGYIATNQHVVAGADLVEVIFDDGRVYSAEIIGTDVRTDLAVLQIPATGLIPIEFGSTESAEIGEVAIAVGSPLGLEGGSSLTVGVVSAFGRQVRTGSGETDILFDMLQTDAPITQGSSGGALVDGEGRLLGITSAIGVSSAGAEGIGFAIPIELVMRITDEIIETGTVDHAFLGVGLRNSFADEPDGARVPSGAVISEFATNPSAAATAGLELGDVIVGYNGNPVLVRDDLISGLRRLRVGDTVTLDVVRDDERLAVTVVLGSRPDDL